MTLVLAAGVARRFTIPPEAFLLLGRNVHIPRLRRCLSVGEMRPVAGIEALTRLSMIVNGTRFRVKPIGP